MRNYHFWGTAFLVFLAVAIVLRILAFAGGAASMKNEK